MPEGHWTAYAAEFISRVGFPIFVAVWMLVRTEKVLRSLTEAVVALTATVQAKKGD